VIEQYQGCLLGIACGDALGGPVEFQTREQIRAAHPNGLRDFIGGGWLHLEPGEITDDTQMTLALARSLANGGPLDMEDVGARFIEWYRSKPKDIGNTTRAALKLLDEGESWDRTGKRAMREARSAAGNGSVMRCAPVALRFRQDPEALVRASIDTARITHADLRCTAGAVAINQAIACLLMGGSTDDALESAVAGIHEPETVAAVRRAPSLTEPDVPCGGFVLDTVTAAFWALCNHDSLEETIVAAVALGGDADTTGAVAGALAGARYRVKAIPARWLERLQHREELEMLSARLYELSNDL
jgi:ADP-ribosyl-[dinitrogen reductase] hydrolase